MINKLIKLKRKWNSLKSINAILLLLLLSNCKHLSYENYKKYPKSSFNELLKKHSDNSQTILSFDAQITSKIITNSSPFVFKMFVLYGKPDKIRIESMTPFGNPISTFIFSKGKIKLHDISNNTLIIGSNPDKHLEELIHIPLNAIELSRLINLEIPFPAQDNLFYYKDEKYFFYPTQSKYKYAYLTLHDEYISSIYLVKENDILEINYLDYKQIGQTFFPHKIVIKTKNKSLMLHVKKIKFLNSLSKNSFILNVDKNAKRYRLED